MYGTDIEMSTGIAFLHNSEVPYSVYYVVRRMENYLHLLHPHLLWVHPVRDRHSGSSLSNLSCLTHLIPSDTVSCVFFLFSSYMIVSS